MKTGKRTTRAILGVGIVKFNENLHVMEEDGWIPAYNFFNSVAHGSDIVYAIIVSKPIK